MMRIGLGLLLAGVAGGAMAQQDPHAGHGMGMTPPAVTQLMPGFGNGGFQIQTQVPEAQAYFSNGMELAFAFEHKAAKAAMAEAVRLDPSCVMCAWGNAWVNGPTINYNIEGDDLATAQKLARTADALAKRSGTAFEREMTKAIVARYKRGGGWGEKGDLAFEAAMERIATENPANDSLQVIAADAVLNAAGDVDHSAIVAIARRSMGYLAPVLARDPDDTGAIHWYIHASEMADLPAHAAPFADRLGRLAPNSQHLVHMPSHTYYWVGRYRDAGLANLKAVQIGMANAAAMKEPPAEGPFSLMYHTHNVHFGLGGAMIAGDSETALAIARPLLAAAADPKSKMFANPRAQNLAGKGLVALGLFAPDELMAMKAPEGAVMQNYWHYARGEALAAKGDAAGVKAELAAMKAPAIVRDPKLESNDWVGATILTIAKDVLAGRAAMLEKRYPDAIAAFARGAALEEGEDFSSMADPPYWWYPVRRSLAEARLAAGDSAGARTDAEATLKRRPNEPGTLVLMTRLDGTKAAAR